MESIRDYHLARQAAEQRAAFTGLDVAIRKVKEYGIVRYTINFASRNDSDYDMAEIVQPTDALIPN